jgi:hypothetical protein
MEIYGDWGLGIGDWGLGPIPNPQSPTYQIYINILCFIKYNIIIKYKKNGRSTRIFVI